MIVLLSAPHPGPGAEGVLDPSVPTEGVIAASDESGPASSPGDDDVRRPAPYVLGERAPRSGADEEAAMGLMFRPRRPLMRVAAGAGAAAGAYKGGPRRQQQKADNDQAQAAYPPTQAPPAAPPPAGPPPAAAGRAPADSTAELERLAKLHESGALSDEEFSAAKSKLLGI